MTNVGSYLTILLQTNRENNEGSDDMVARLPFWDLDRFKTFSV